MHESLKTESMKNLEKIRLICEENTKTSEKLIDGFLLYYAAKYNNPEQVMNRKFASFKHLNNKLKQVMDKLNNMKSNT